MERKYYHRKSFMQAAYVPYNGKEVLVIRNIGFSKKPFLVVPGYVTDEKLDNGVRMSSIELISDGYTRSDLEARLIDAGFTETVNFWMQ